MVKHIIIWTLKEGYSEEEKSAIKNNVKVKLEALSEQIDGIIEIKVQTECLPTSNADLLLDSTFTSRESLATYAKDPRHVKIATEDVVPFVATRSCIDFEI